MPDLAKLLALPAGAELDAAVAEHVMGFEWWVSQATGCRGLFLSESRPDWFKAKATGTEARALHWNCRIRPYSTSHDACAEVLAEVERRGCGKAWVEVLDDIDCRDVLADDHEYRLFKFATAIPEQKCKAALAAVLGGKE